MNKHLALSVVCILIFPWAADADTARDNTQPLILSTDIGGDVDDVYAVGLALASSEFVPQAITTTGSQAADRAWIICRLLTHLKKGSTLVAFGRGEQPQVPLDWQIQYRRHPAVVWNRTAKPSKTPAAELLLVAARDAQGKVTIVATGPVTNLATAIKGEGKFPEKVQGFYVTEQGLRADQKAAKVLLESGAAVFVIPQVLAEQTKLDPQLRRDILDSFNTLTAQVAALVELAESPHSHHAATLAVACAAGLPAKWLEGGGSISDLAGKKKLPQVRVATSVDEAKFHQMLRTRLLSYGESVLPGPPKNRSKPACRGGLPRRVHAVEDYDTEIEKRWWMTGKLETKAVPPGGRRAQRAMITQDYDAKMGDSGAVYRAVIFNPVPGPPMGPRTRLTFRYKLRRTDTIRVQLFSLSRGYHRYLSITDLPQGKWQTATVDMTEMRRPDGSGGPLAEDERIDDIQFYIDPRGELLIDDIVLYEAAPKDETRPFPKSIHFTGWFDTGKQGREWPGDFEIVLHNKPRTWDAVKSVASKKLGRPWFRIDLRGDRPLGPHTALQFEYKLSGASEITVEIRDRQKVLHRRMLSDLKIGEWSEAHLQFTNPGKREPMADEIRLILPEGGDLLIDDLLLYEPGG